MTSAELVDIIKRQIEYWGNVADFEQSEYAQGSYAAYYFMLKYAMRLGEPETDNYAENV